MSKYTIEFIENPEFNWLCLDYPSGPLHSRNIEQDLRTEIARAKTINGKDIHAYAMLKRKTQLLSDGSSKLVFRAEKNSILSGNSD
jgi:hypothetical protein